MNDLRLLLQADKDHKIINLEFKQISNLELLLPILSKFENLESLSLNGNRLQSLPKDLASLEKLSQLDISNNLFRDVIDIIPALKTLPRLSHLLYSFRNDDEENLLKKQLPKLERLNKKPLNNVTIINKKQKSGSSVMKLSQQDLQNIAVIYDDIRDMFKRSKYYVDKQLADEFDKGVDNIMNELSTKLASASGEQEINSSIIGCKYALIDLCFVKFITYFYHFDKNIASIVERIHDHIAESFKSMSEIMKSTAERSKIDIAQVAVKKQQLFKTQIKRLKAIQENHLNQISALQSKNAELLDKITKNSKNNVLETTINNLIKKKQSRSPAKGKGAQALAESEINIKFNKSLTLNQLKEVINQIYISKSKHNQICRQSNIAMETLQTHMYTYLNQKYGLKPMTVEWAMSIVNGIKKYGPEDTEVTAFGKILRNQLQEQFVQTLKKVKSSIRQATKRFKGQQFNNLISPHEAEQILLICGNKREAIDLIMSRVKKQNLQDGHLSPAYLQNLLLEYVLRKHCEKLRRLSNIFRSVDTDDDGIVNHDQIFVLLQKLQIKHDIQFEEIVLIMDPFRTNSVTFSHLVQEMQRIPDFKQAFV